MKNTKKSFGVANKNGKTANDGGGMSQWGGHHNAKKEHSHFRMTK
jgi:hypothetical protein